MTAVLDTAEELSFGINGTYDLAKEHATPFHDNPNYIMAFEIIRRLYVLCNHSNN